MARPRPRPRPPPKRGPHPDPISEFELERQALQLATDFETGLLEVVGALVGGSGALAKPTRTLILNSTTGGNYAWLCDRNSFVVACGCSSGTNVIISKNNAKAITANDVQGRFGELIAQLLPSTAVAEQIQGLKHPVMAGEKIWFFSATTQYSAWVTIADQ